MDQVLASIAACGSVLDSPYLYLTIIVVGLLWGRHPAMFGRTLLLVCFTMIYNLGLKSIWKVPLPPLLDGWAFPSGHMHAAVIFWGWLSIEIRRVWFSEIVLLILLIVAYGLLYHGYHWPLDILGAIGFGGLSLVIYAWLNRQAYIQAHPYWLGYGLFAIATMIGIAVYPDYGSSIVFKSVWAMLIVTSVTWNILARDSQTT